MTSQQQLAGDLAESTGQHPDSRWRTSALVRTAQFASVIQHAGLESGMELERFLVVPLTTLDGHPCLGMDIVQQPTLLILVDAYRAKPERSAAEVAWVQERLEHGIDLVLIWPGRALHQARALNLVDDTRQFLDVGGYYRRLVSPSGKRTSVLADPVHGTFEKVTAASDVFAIGHGLSGSDDRGSDHMIDLGDVFR
jgi:hypothetical protein